MTFLCAQYRLTITALVLVAISLPGLSGCDNASAQQFKKPPARPSANAPAKAPAKAAASTRYKSVLIDKVPHIRQKPDFCGEACVAMWLGRLGRGGDQDYVFDRSGLDPTLGRGCWSRELKTAIERIGFRPGPVFYPVAPARASVEIKSLFGKMIDDLAKGIPSIVCMHYHDAPKTTEHFRLVLGYDATRDEVIYHEPAVDKGASKRMSRDLFIKLWPLKYKSTAWTVVRFRLEPYRVEKSVTSKVRTDADYAQHILKLKKKVPKGFTIVLQKPFVVIGDETPAAVRRRAEGTVKWSVDRLKKEYFTKDPRDIIDVWLFKDKASYEKNALALFKKKPTTPFGYFSPTHKALVMNISTGGGTLVHEIVHPFVASNFPECPSWFNEGLASLYEQSSSRSNRIVGLTNWRLRGLQKAIGKKTVPPFKSLCDTTTHQFYNMDRGTNYSQARYLCYYLQEKGLLRTYYHAFKKNVRTDPTGYNTLVTTLGKPDMAKFQKQWEAYVMKLRFR